MRKSGIAFHCHHNFLCEPVFDYDERVASIKETKPKEEQELRLRLLQLFPNDRLPQTLVKAGEDYSKAGEAYSKAGEAYRKDIVKLHAELCPNCPWDGHTIFTREDKDGNWY